MLRIIIDPKESLEKNASAYFEKAKKTKKKIEGAKNTIEKTKKKLASKIELKPKSVTKKIENIKRAWYEKFRWFISSEGFLIIGGRDATTNEILIKKHTDKEDIVFHTDMAGSPFFIIKSDGKIPGKETIQEVSNATCTFSRAWKMGLATIDVFHVKPEQVTKEAQSGEYLTKGAFMIKGKTNYTPSRMDLAVGLYNDKIMAGPVNAVKKHCKDFVELIQGKDKASEVAKKIKTKIGGDLDEIIRILPAGGFNLK